MAPSEPVILYIYDFSPFGRRVTQYLTLRNIPYKTVDQPVVPPRPDLAAIGVKYRRIPVMAIGRDVYCDTKCILAKLEHLFPASAEHPGLGATNAKDRGLERLVEKWGTDIFMSVCTTISPDVPALSDETFAKDRSEFFGGKWGPERQRELRPTGLQSTRADLAFLDGLVQDNQFIQGDHVSLADVHALFLYDWIDELLPGSVPQELSEQFPAYLAWRARYRDAFKAAKAKAKAPEAIDGAAATAALLGAGFAETEGTVDPADPLALKKGDKVEVWPTDVPGGYKDRETGSLVALGIDEVVVETKAKDKDVPVRVHFPRWGYKVNKV